MVKKIIIIVVVLAVVFSVINAIIPRGSIGNKCEMKVYQPTTTMDNTLKGKHFVLLMDNSGSMKGYMDFASATNPNEFKTAKRTAISTISAILDNVKEATGKEAVTYCGNIMRAPNDFIKDFQNSTLFSGATTELAEMMSDAAEKANDTTIVGLFSDLILSAGKAMTLTDIDYNLHHLKDLEAGIHKAAMDVKEKGLDIAIVPYESDFNGTYYYTYREVRRDELLDKRMERRPYYIVLIGKKELLQAMIDKCLKVSSNDKEIFSTVCREKGDSTNETFTISPISTPSPWIIGDPKNSPKSTSDKITIWTKANLKKAQGEFKISYETLPIPYFAYTKIEAVGYNNSQTISTIKDISKTSCVLELKPYDTLPKQGVAKFNLVVDNTLWNDTTRVLVDDYTADIKNMKGKTWGLDAFMSGIIKAYDITDSTFVLAEIEIKILKK